MKKALESIVSKFLKESENKQVLVISHHDTDGITSASIISRALSRANRTFTLKIVKQLDSEFIDTLPKDSILLFLDLASASLEQLSSFPNVFIVDHHEIPTPVPENINIINPHIFNEEEISASGLSYMFAKQISQENKDLASLAIVGMVGDMLDRNLSKLNNEILNDAEIVIKRGLLFYPATRPIHKTLEFSSSIFIPGVTGNSRGVYDLLKESGIERKNNEYPTLLELDEEQNSHLITAVLLRRHAQNNEDIIGNIYLVKSASRLEDARELSAMINACSRLGFSEVALLLCLGNKSSRTRAENVYANYKQHLVAALNLVSSMKKIEGPGYVIINAKKEIKDTIIGTVASILSNSQIYEQGTIIVTLAHSEDKIKASARVAGKQGRNARELLEIATSKVGGECGGHHMAAGCLISQDKETEFLDYLKKALDIELVKV